MKKLIALFLALLMTVTMMLPVGAYDASADVKAQVLKEVGLFLGTNNGFELDRAPNRMEAIIMLIRMTGNEVNALYGEDWEHPFTDAPAWEDASKYLGYAYENGLTEGVTDTTFNPKGVASAQMYVTFMLRALGYQDTDGKTVWDNWEVLAKEANILPDIVDTKNFTRGDAVLVSYAALDAKMVTEDVTLKTYLMGMGAFAGLTFAKAEIVGGKEVTAKSDLIDIAALIYQGTPARTNSLAVTEINEENISFFLGVDKLDYAEAIAIEPMMSSNAHSICIVRMKDAKDCEAAAKAIKENVDGWKWCCVGVEDDHIHTVIIDDLVILIMDNYGDAQFVANAETLKK